MTTPALTSRSYRALVPFAFVALGAIVLARTSIAAIYAKLGHPGGALDDSYIHFQYARAIAEGHPLRYQSGEPITSGATSFLWPLLLAPFYLVGFRGEAILWPAWILSFAALAGLAWEAHALTKKLAGRDAALGAAAMVLAFSGFTWAAASGMEGVPFAWAIASAARRASEWIEEEDANARTLRREGALVALGWIAPLLRPEGAIASLTVALALFVRPRLAPASPKWTAHVAARARSLIAFGAVIGLRVLLFVLTGHAQSSTASVKLLAGNPYFDFFAASEQNVRVFFETILNGEVWSAEFLPPGGAKVAVMGLIAIAVVGYRAKKPWRAAFVLLLALTMLAPCTYVTFLWNRLRYLWPFATGWIIGLACFARLVGDACATISARFRVATLLLSGVFAGLFATKIGGVSDDLANSASGIDRQQVALGHWAREHLPNDARIGVNDTGAIAYFSLRHTFDVVGLTTASEGKYWVAGAGSRLEHYERMKRETPELLPTHFIVYPEWMACRPVLGSILHEATVTDSSILGGQSMVVYEATYDTLGSGALPWTTGGSAPRLHPYLDELDVADLESEEAHQYELLGARDGEEIAFEGESPAGSTVVDGGRTMRTHERFRAKIAAADTVHAIMRLAASTDTELHLFADGEEIAKIEVEGTSWREVAFDVPAKSVHGNPVIEVKTRAPITVFHYWFEGRPQPL